MDKNRLRFPRLNLSRSGATPLAVFGIYEANEERLALLPKRPDGPRQGRRGPGLYSVTRYKTRGVGSAMYEIAATVHANNDLTEIHVSISYRQETGGVSRRPPDSVPEETILELSQAMGVPQEVDGVVLFECENRQPSHLWFPLPVSLAGTSPEDIIEVRGVRGAKLGTPGLPPEYEFILDRPSDDKVMLQIELNQEGRITPESPRAAPTCGKCCS